MIGIKEEQERARKGQQLQVEDEHDPDSNEVSKKRSKKVVKIIGNGEEEEHAEKQKTMSPMWTEKV